MESGFSKRLTAWAAAVFMCLSLAAETTYSIKASQAKQDVKDLSQRSSTVYDQNGERCALIRFETPVPTLFNFQLGAQSYEKREDKDDEVCLWVSADVRKITITCENCQPLRDYRVQLKPGCVYHAKLTTNLPQETATSQYLNLYCEHVPFTVSIDGAEPDTCNARTFNKEIGIGSHEVLVTSHLYKPVRKTLRLLRGRACNDTIHMENNYGELVLSVNQTGYTVYVDDVPQTGTRTFRIEPGIHRLTVRKDRYETYETQITVVLGEIINMSVKLIAAHAIFNITAKEKETEIWIDGQMRGHGQTSIALDYGVHTIEGRREGYDSWEYKVHEFNASSDRAISIPKLTQQWGSLRISTFPDNAVIRLDGMEVSTKDGIFTMSTIPTGKHYVHIRCEDYRSVVDTFTIHSGQRFTHDYQLERIPTGVVSITTDRDVAIYVLDDNKEMSYLGKGNFSGKMHAGEQTIVLKNTDGITCSNNLFISEGKDEQIFTLPFMRKLKIRTNAIGAKMQLEANRRIYPVKPHKKIKIEPQKYTLTATRKGYETLIDTIDLSRQNTKYTVHHAMMRKEGQASAPPAPKTSNSVIHRFYDNAGRWFIGIIDFGYMFDFGAMSHSITAGILPFRYKMLGVNLLDAEIAVASHDTTFKAPQVSYRPKVSLVVPVGPGFAFTFYGGVTLNITNMAKQLPMDCRLLGGASMQINKSGVFPVNIFGEYHYPLEATKRNAPGYSAVQQFRVGLTFTLGVDR